MNVTETIKKIYRKVVPEAIRQKIKEREIYREFENLRRTPGHVFYCFDETRSIFIHIPKAGGISAIKSLYGEEANGFGHPRYTRFLRIYGKKYFDEYFKFTFVRNPWDRLFSAYCFLKKGGINHMDQQFCNDVLNDYNSFEQFVMEWVNAENVMSWVHFIPQYCYVYDANMILVVDFIGYYESFSDDFEKVKVKLGIGSSLKHFNKTKEKQQSYKDVYTIEMMEKVAEIYNKDIELFKYKF